MSTATINEVKISNIGPIQQLTIPLPEKGGVVVLTGGQGTGKSTALRAISAAAGTKADVPLRDGATRGAVEFAGARLGVTKSRSTRTGELTVETIEGRYDIGALVDPQIKDPERADAARIKQLLSLTGAKADITPYVELLGKTRWEVLDVDAATDCPIELYSRVVRALQAKARDLERQASETRVDIDSLGLARIDALPDVDAAQAVAAEADRELTRIRSRQEQAAKDAEHFASAQQHLSVLKSEYEGPSLDEARTALDEAEAFCAEITRQLAIARDELATAKSEYQRAQQHHDAMAKFAKALAEVEPVQVDQAEVDAAAVAREKAQAAFEQAVALRAKSLMADRARKANEQADKLAAYATGYRDCATKAETVLATILPDSGIRVIDGRLVVATDRSQNELYAELSHGERAILAIRTAAKYIPPGGVATISQEMWGGISEENRKLIAAEARKQGVVIITAQVTDAPLDVEVL